MQFGPRKRPGGLAGEVFDILEEWRYPPIQENYVRGEIKRHFLDIKGWTKNSREAGTLDAAIEEAIQAFYHY